MNQKLSSDKNIKGVIWICGYSASGKTTVGRILESKLKKQGISTVFLDGDDLRSVFAGKWGFKRKERIELAHIYLRLCSHLSSQGFVVILSAVALYKEVSEWFHINIPRGLQVFLNVPEIELRRRDASTKKLYNNQKNFKSMYDKLELIDKYIDNFDIKPEKVADEIFNSYFNQIKTNADFGRKEHWNDFYSKEYTSLEASPFAKNVAKTLSVPVNMIEVGCGNGRDTLFFTKLGIKITAIDVSDRAISFCKQNINNDLVTFKSCALSDISDYHLNEFDAVYCRFVIHAMPIDEEISMLNASLKVLKPGGQLFIECRSINDPMARLGEIISPTERIYKHYRRFIILNEFRERVRAAGFQIKYELESNNLAIHKNENPVIIRLIGEKHITKK